MGELALKQPVSISPADREYPTLPSIEDCRRRERRDREVLLVEELSDADLEAIGKAEVPAGYAHLNAELSEP